MSDRQYKPPSFSLVQVAAAWFVGLALGTGIFGLIAFRQKAWIFAFVVPLLFSAIITAVSIITFTVTHWSEHD